ACSSTWRGSSSTGSIESSSGTSSVNRGSARRGTAIGDWELTSAAGASLDELLELYDREVATAREIVAAAPDLDALASNDSRGRINLRWILLHRIEEYARHCGHADLIRESIDGTVGG